MPGNHNDISASQLYNFHVHLSMKQLNRWEKLRDQQQGIEPHEIIAHPLKEVRTSLLIFNKGNCRAFSKFPSLRGRLGGHTGI